MSPALVLCENCYADVKRDPCRVRMTVMSGWEGDLVGKATNRFDKRLCRLCANCLVKADFTAYRRRHTARPKRLRLP
jgi:hypothetical protein